MNDAIAFVVQLGNNARVEALIPSFNRSSGRSSGVEHDLAKVGVEGSNPFARSSFSNNFIYLQSKYMFVFFHFVKLGGNLAEKVIRDILREARTGKFSAKCAEYKPAKSDLFCCCEVTFCLIARRLNDPGPSLWDETQNPEFLRECADDWIFNRRTFGEISSRCIILSSFSITSVVA